MTDLKIPILDSKKSKAWPKHASGPRASYLLPAEAFTQRYPTDSHFAAYSVPGVARRLADAAAIEQRAPSGGIPMVLLVVDVDAPKHGAAGPEAVETWFAGEREKLLNLEAAHPGAFWYRTRGGYRVVYELGKPFVIRSEEHRLAWRRFYERACCYLARAFGFLADTACADWTRLYRLPLVLREGEQQITTYESGGDPGALGAWAYVPRDTDLEADMATARELAASEPEGKGPWSTVIKHLTPEGEPGGRVSPPATPPPPPRRAAARPRGRGRPSLEEREELDGRKALDRLCGELASMPQSSGRNIALNSAAVQLGHYVPHILNEGEVTDRLREAARACHMDASEIDPTIASGLGKGKSEPQYPRDRPSWKDEERAKPSARASMPFDPETGEIPMGDDDQGEAADTMPPPSGERRAGQRREPADRRAVQPLDPWIYKCTDTGNAERLVARHGADLRYCHPWGKWFAWTGQRWSVDETGTVRRRAKETARSIYAEAAAIKARKAGDENSEKQAEERRKMLGGWAVKSESRDRREAMAMLAQSEETIPVVPAQLNADPWLFNVQNGTLDLHTGELRPHRREDMQTKIAPVAYDQAAKCPVWLAFLDRIMGGDRELVGFLQRFAGYCLTGVVREHVLVSLFGKGSNGKSTFLETLLAMFGEYGWQAPPDLLLMKQNDGHPTDMASLFGARLAVCMETAQNRRLDEAKMKQLTGGDTITARKMREDFWTFTPTHKLVLGTNHKPIVSTTDHGTWRRQKLVPFLVQIPDAEQDKMLKEKLRAELSGILRWAVEGCLAWQRDGLGEPAAVKKATAGWRDESDLLGAFLADCCELGPRLEARAGELYAAYTAHCQACGEEPTKSRAFGMSLTERGLTTGKSNGKRLWRGIRLLSTFEQRMRGEQSDHPPPGSEGSEGPEDPASTAGKNASRVENARISDPSDPSDPAPERRTWYDA